MSLDRVTAATNPELGARPTRIEPVCNSGSPRGPTPTSSRTSSPCSPMSAWGGSSLTSPPSTVSPAPSGTRSLTPAALVIVAVLCLAVSRHLDRLPAAAQRGSPCSWRSLLGLVVWALWVGLDGHYPELPFLGKRVGFDVECSRQAGAGRSSW